MKIKLSILVILFCFFNIQSFAQEKTRKEIKAEQKLKKEKEVETLVNSKNFVFDAEKALPQGYRTINLDYNTYSVKFNLEKVECDLPYFGRAFNVSYGSDGGMKFEGKPENIKIEKKKKYYSVKATVKGKNDVYNLLFSVYFEGGATLSINSNDRASISYDGQIRAPKADVVK